MNPLGGQEDCNSRQNKTEALSEHFALQGHEQVNLQQIDAA
jgi:hypothetical protein